MFNILVHVTVPYVFIWMLIMKVANIFFRGLGPLNQEFTYFLILQENGEELNEFATPNEINIISL